jgi:Gram-negative bacterial TonB protein C-terminal
MSSASPRGMIITTVALFLVYSLTTNAQSVRNGGDFSNAAQPLEKVPAGVILVKGAWSSASDSVTPVPEDASVANGVFTDKYFGITYPLPKDWTQKYKGAPPSDSGRYVLGQIVPAETYKGQSRGSILITADDMFFTSLPASNALQLIDYSKDNLQADHQLELPPTQTKIAGHPFMFYAYWSPVAELHWYVLATEIRCHTVQMILSSRDTKLLQSLVLDMKSMQLPEEANPAAGNGGGDVPVCIKDYAIDQHVIARADPIFTERRFNSVPVRIIIDKDGRVKHIHYLSSFPDQAKAISDAFKKWQFRPYRKNGQPVEVETGIMFGRSSHPATSAKRTAATE